MTNHGLATFLRDGLSGVYSHKMLIQTLGVEDFANYLRRQWLQHRKTDSYLCHDCGEAHYYIQLGEGLGRRCTLDPTASLELVPPAEMVEYIINWYALRNDLCVHHKLLTCSSSTQPLFILGNDTKRVFALSFATNDRQLQSHVESFVENHRSHIPTLIYSGLFTLPNEVFLLIQSRRGQLITIDDAFKLRSKTKTAAQAKVSKKVSLNKRPTFILDTKSIALKYADKTAQLTANQYKVAHALWEANGSPVKNIIELENSNLERIMLDLRKKLSKISNNLISSKNVIITRRSIGYSLNTETYFFEFQL